MTNTLVSRNLKHRRAPWLDVILFLVAGAALLALGAAAPDAGTAGRLVIPLRTLCFLALLTWLLRRAGESWQDFGLHRPGYVWRAAGAILGGYLLIASAGSLLILGVLPALGWSGQATEAFVQLRGNGREYAYWLAIAWSCAAFGEELAFRGFLFPRLERLFGGRGAAAGLALLVQAILFGFSHGYQGAGGMLVSGVTGLILGGVYLACGRNLVVCILLHGIVDTISLSALFAGLQLPG